jgi:4-amino-4-deoxy-L-arabinose transferase-like glycosyltransferase
MLAAALLCVAFLAVTLPHLGVTPIERAEIYFLDAARTMVETGDYMVPRYQGQAFYDKPALSYWLMAGSFNVLGVGLGAGRLASVLAAGLCLALTFALGRILFSARVGVAASAVLATTFAFLSFARLAMSDMLLCLFVLGAVTAGAAWVDRAGNRAILAALLGASLGLGFLTKGPVAVIFAGAGLCVLAFLRRPALRDIRLAHVVLAAAAFAACGLGWFAVLWAREGPAPLRYFFLQENLERFAGDRYHAERGPFYFFIAYLAEGLPWSLFLPLALWSLRSESPSAGRRAAASLLGWMMLMLVPLTVSRGKIDYYLLPLYPAASLVTGRFLVSVLRAGQRTAVRAVLAVLALVFLALCAAQARVPADWLPAGWPRLALPASGVVAALLLAWAAWRGRPQHALTVPALASALAFTAFAHVSVPAFRSAQPQARAVSDIARELKYRPDARVVYCDDVGRLQRDVLFEVRATMAERCDLLVAAASRQPQLFVLDPDERSFLASVATMRDIADYPVLPATVATLDGLLEGVRPTRVVLAANYDSEDPVAQLKWRKERRRAIRAMETAERRD